MLRLGSVEDRFWQNVDKRGPDECWEWTVSRCRAGYGQFQIDGKKQKATRVSMMLANGRYPKEQACHTCDNPPCVNPKHLFDGTQKENLRDASEQGRLRRQNDTLCSNGHTLTPESTYWRPDGGRDCRACMSRRGAEYRSRKRALTAEFA
jgi:hypothetical protein